MPDKCFNCYTKGKYGKTLWGCCKCNFLICERCSVANENARICFGCRNKETETDASASSVQQGGIDGNLYEGMPEAFLRRVMPQQRPTPSMVDHHLLQFSGAVPYASATDDKAKTDREAIAEIERRLRRLQGNEVDSQPKSGPKCGMCGALANFRCPECLQSSSTGVQELYCKRCLTITHSNNDDFKNHKPNSIN